MAYRNADNSSDAGHRSLTIDSEGIEDLSDDALLKAIEDTKIDAKHLELENQVFENFLLKNDPSLLAGLEQVLDMGKMHSQTHVATGQQERRETSDSISLSCKKTESSLKFGAPTVTSGDRGPRINLSQKTDLVMREMEQMQLALEKFINISHRRKCNLKAELEEIGIRKTELAESRETFEERVVIEGINHLTQKISEEKFVRYMDEWLKSAQSTLEKMRLRTSTFKTSFIKLTHQMIAKEELGEKIDAVDFDQLHIENGHLSNKIEQKNSHLLELKRMNGIANLVLSTHRKYLQNQVLELNGVKQAIKQKELTIIDLDKEGLGVEKELGKSNEKYESIVDTIEHYKAPETMEYVKIKSQLSDLKKNVRVLERKNPIIEFALNSCIRQMKILTGSKHVQPSWFILEGINDYDDFSLLDANISIKSVSDIGSESNA